MRRALCESVRDATAFAYRARAFVSVLCAWGRVATGAIVYARLYNAARAMIARKLHARLVQRATRAR